MSCDKAKCEAELKKAFDKADKDHSGFIDSGEIESVLREYYRSMGATVPDKQIKDEASAFVKDVDKNKDNKASLQEFTNYVMQLH